MLSPPGRAYQTRDTVRLETLKGTTLFAPTSLVFGADGRLYISQQTGSIRAYAASLFLGAVVILGYLLY